MDLQKHLDALLSEQMNQWPLLAENRLALSEVKHRSFQYDGFTVRLQYNPKRIISSSADIDKQSVARRKCFLCAENRPGEQRQLAVDDSYIILCNPYPIFAEHYTISSQIHTAQTIQHSIAEFIALSEQLTSLVLFYNGPQCGASAPDHLHFQAGSRAFLPVEKELADLKRMYGRSIVSKSDNTVTAVDDGFRRFFAIESQNPQTVEYSFKHLMSCLPEEELQSEAMINVLCWYDKGWTLLVFVRGKHRPWQYYAEGDDNILLSPASVDYGGVLVLPLEKDFKKVSKADVADMLNQTSVSGERFTHVCDKMIKEGLFEN